MKDKSFRLTKNEKTILKRIIEKGRVTDTEISKNMKVSQQAVNQMRTRLENEGIIQGYLPIIDFKKVGIKLLYFAGVEILPELWRSLSEGEINQRIYDIPFLFMAFRIPSADISYILMFGFKDFSEQERFSKLLETRLSGQMRIRWSYSCGIENLLAYDSLNLVFHALGDGANFKDAVDSLGKK